MSRLARWWYHDRYLRTRWWHRAARAVRARLRRWAGYGWQFDVVDDDHAHIRPRRDKVSHDLDEACVCSPTPEPIVRDDGSVAWNLIHHSLDGREAHE